jgi:two-component system, chemotaxis family, sensor kinase Cph1
VVERHADERAQLVNAPEKTVDVDNCDQEPIHVPGAVQPHGVLLVLGGELEVREVSDNVGAVLGIDPALLFGVPIERVLDSSAAEQIRRNQGASSWQRFNPLAAEVGGRKFDAIVHRSNHGLVVELEPTDLVPQGTYRDYGADTHQAMMRIQGAESLAALLQRAAEVVRWVTGYDRVMVYRFSEEGHGQVVAAEREPSLEPFLGLHYPASDIPAQARRLHVLNWLRTIVDVDYRPAQLLQAPGALDETPLDLTYSALRSELLGQMLSTLILSWRLKEEALRKEAIGARRVRLMERLTRADYIASGLTEAPDDLFALMGASGAAIIEDGRCTRVGQCPSEELLRAFAAWMAEQKHEVFASHGMAVEFPGAPVLGEGIAGALALGLPQTEANVVIWFRPAIERTVSWAGNPEKTYSEGPNGPRLTPFKRARELSRASKYSGLGLGLYIVKRVVEMHEGQVRVASSEEHGTVCTVTLPRAVRGATP